MLNLDEDTNAMIYTIIMNSDKTLTATVTTNLYQRENLVDKIYFLFPQEYNCESLSDYVATLKWIDPANEAHSEILTLDEALYKERLRYILPVDTEFTKFAGTLKLRITFSKTDNITNETYVLHTGDIDVTILPRNEYIFASSDNDDTESEG